MLTMTDNIVIVVLAGFIIFIGLSFSKSVTDMESYYLGNRSLPWSLTVGALVATWYGGSGTLGSVEYYAIFGASLWLIYCLAAHVGRMPLALWIGPKMRVRTDITVPDLLHKTYGKGVALLGAVFMVIYCFQVSNITVAGFIGKVAWGWPYLLTGGIVVALVVLIAVAAGLMGVAVTDMLLFWCLGFSVAAVVPLQWADIGGFEGLRTALSATPELLDPVSGITPMKGMMFIILALGVYADPTFYQRFSASESPNAGRHAMLLCLVIWIIFDIVLVITGLMVAALYPDMAPGEGYVTLVLTTLPEGVRALFIVALIGSAISGLDGFFLAGAATMAYDIYGRLSNCNDQKKMVLLTRICVVVLGIAGLCMAFQFTVAYDAYILVGSIWMSAGFVPVVGALLLKCKKTPAGGYLSMIFGGGAYILLKLFPVALIEEPLVAALPISFVAWIIGNHIGKSVEEGGHITQMGGI